MCGTARHKWAEKSLSRYRRMPDHGERYPEWGDSCLDQISWTLGNDSVLRTG